MIRSLTALAISLAVSFPSLAQHLSYAVAQPPITLREIEALPDDDAALREIRHERLRVDFGATPLARSVRWDFPPVVPAFAAPAVTTSFASTNSFQIVPGDANGAVGKNHVFTATNDRIAVHTRSGNIVNSAYLFQFLQSGPGGTRADVYDPRVAYDAAVDRWIVVGIQLGQNVLLAVSDNGDPTGNWSRYKFHHTGGFGEVDFTRMALTRNSVLVGVNDDASSWMVSIAKSDLYANPFSLPMKTYQTGTTGAMPVESEDSAIEYVVYNFSGDMYVRRLDQLTPKYIDGTFSWSKAWVFAPQLGSTQKIDMGYMDVEKAVLRDGKIYVVHAGMLDSPDRSAVIWWVFNPETQARLGGGIIEDPTGETFYSYPSLAVNRAGAFVIGFGMFSAKRYPSAGFVYVNRFGAVSTVGTIKAGTSAGPGIDRWGDYTNTVVDPLDDSVFWSVQLIGDSRTWQSWWGRIPTATAGVKGRAVRH